MLQVCGQDRSWIKSQTLNLLVVSLFGLWGLPWSTWCLKHSNHVRNMLAEGQIKSQDEERPDTSSKISQTSFYLCFCCSSSLERKKKRHGFHPNRSLMSLRYGIFRLEFRLLIMRWAASPRRNWKTHCLSANTLTVQDVRALEPRERDRLVLSVERTRVLWLSFSAQHLITFLLIIHFCDII